MSPYVIIGIVIFITLGVVIGAIYFKTGHDALLPYEYLRKTEREGLDSKKVLCIGNSYSDDSVKYIPAICDDLKIKKVQIANLFIGGCTLKTHCENAKTGAKAYEYRKFVGGEWTNREGVSLLEAIEDEEWDVIVFQQQSSSAGVWQTYTPYLTELTAFVREKSNARFAFNMTWACPTGSTWGGFEENYQSDEQKMYESIASVVSSRIELDFNYEYVIPTGTAVQNARARLGNVLNRDGGHLNEKGRFLASLMWVKELFDVNIDELTYCIDEVSIDEIHAFTESVNQAYKHPYVVTKE